MAYVSTDILQGIYKESTRNLQDIYKPQNVESPMFSLVYRFSRSRTFRGGREGVI